MVHFSVLYISGRRRPPNVVGPGVANPIPHPLDGPVSNKFPTAPNFLARRGQWPLSLSPRPRRHCS